jgi:hypothetical protein
VEFRRERRERKMSKLTLGANMKSMGVRSKNEIKKK